MHQTSQRDAAFKIFKELAADTKTLYGAEAKFLMVQDAYDRGKFQEVQDLVYGFAQAGSASDYYLAKAFLVLGDSFADQEEFAQAKATFESLRDGYTAYGADDDIPEAVRMRLEKLEEITKSE